MTNDNKANIRQMLVELMKEPKAMAKVMQTADKIKEMAIECASNARAEGKPDGAVLLALAETLTDGECRSPYGGPPMPLELLAACLCMEAADKKKPAMPEGFLD